MTTQVRTRGGVKRATLHHRKRIDRLSASQLAHVRAAFAKAMAISDERSYWYFAGWHGEPFQWCEHHTELFLPWHRAYLREFELALQTQQPGVSLPWWDWTATAGVPDAYTDTDVDGEPNPLLGSEIRVYRTSNSQNAEPRRPGSAPHATAPPYKTQWDYAMAATSFGEFQTRIEALHDAVHVWVGGIMSNIRWAAYDPLFYAHHVMVDRAWRLWQHRHPGALPGSHLLDVALRPNGIKVRDVLDVKQLGYDYAGTTAHAAGTA